MRKKFIGVYALMAVLALGTTVTSCVDDNESASVTAIRDAKAKQLASLANLNNEKATAVKIKAEAEAAINNAKAAYDKAVAEMKENEAAIAKARLEIDIEAAKAKAEANLLKQKANLETAKAELVYAMDDLADAQKNMATAIIGSMNTLLNEINSINADIVKYTFNKTNAEYELQNKEIAKIEEENENNAEIAYNEALIKEYEKYSQEDLTKAKEAAAAAKKEAEVLQQQFDELYSKYSMAASEQYNLQVKMRESLLVQTAGAYLKQEPYTSTEVIIDFGDGTVAKETNFVLGKYVIDEEAKADLEEQIKNAEANVKAAGFGITEAEKALADKKATQTYKDALAAVTAAEKKLADAKTEQEVNQAQADLQAAKSSLESLTATEEATLKNKQDAKELAENTLENLKKALDCVNDSKAYEEYIKMYDAYVAANKVRFDALIEVTKADHNLVLKQNLAWNLEYVVSKTTDYASLINDCKEAINNAKKDNDALKNVSTQEDLIKFYQSKLDNLNKQLEVKNALYANYEAALNQLIEGETPNLPEEGEEGAETPETPAE